MMKKSLRTLVCGLVAALAASMALAAVEVNQASQADLQTVKGIGPAMSTRLLDERQKSVFKDWPDLIARVSGIGPGNAARFSGGGLTVNGTSFNGEGPAGAAAPPVVAGKAPVAPGASAEKVKASPAQGGAQTAGRSR